MKRQNAVDDDDDDDGEVDDGDMVDGGKSSSSGSALPTFTKSKSRRTCPRPTDSS